MGGISVIGLGAMGSALAQALVKAGHSVTVWNRSRAKIAPLEALGAKGAESVSEAVKASPLVVVSIGNYAATNALRTLGAERLQRRDFRSRTIPHRHTVARLHERLRERAPHRAIPVNGASQLE